MQELMGHKVAMMTNGNLFGAVSQPLGDLNLTVLSSKKYKTITTQNVTIEKKIHFSQNP